MREVVHTKTLKEYDYVNEKLNYKWLKNVWTDERENTCLRTDEREYSSFDYYKYIEKARIISFNEFKSRYELKIGDTFEKDGFVCRVEGEVKKWVYDSYQEAYYKTSTKNKNYTEITNKEFIKQLEENAQ